MSNKVHIKLKAYDHRVLDNAVSKIVETIRKVVKKVRSISAIRIYKNKVEL